MANHRRITVALDIGSTFSGYAYSVEENENYATVMNRSWYPPTGAPHSKTPTALLYHNNGALRSFGFTAIEDIARLNDAARHLFRYFKKSEAQTQRFDFCMKSTNVSNEETNLLTLYAGIMEMLKDQCLQQLRDDGERDVRAAELNWILCVPVVWAVREKEFMIAAAFQAGLIDELCSTNIQVILEADAAYCFCRDLIRSNLSSLIANPTNEQLRKLTESTGMLVVDVGGKTVDVTTKVSQPGTLGGIIENEVRHPSGFMAGGENINLAFENKLEDVFGRNVIDRMKSAHISSWFILMNDFEVQKKKPPTGNNDVILPNISKLLEVYKDINSFDLNAEFRDGIWINRERQLVIPYNVITELAQPTVDVIINHILEKLNENGAITTVLVTGGLAKFEVLFLEIRNRICAVFGDRILIVRPESPDESVLRGALAYSRENVNLQITTVDANYGVRTRQNAEEDMMYPHILVKGKHVLHGNVYKKTTTRGMLQQQAGAPALCVYRNHSNFMSFPLSDRDANGVIIENTDDARVTVQLQVEVHAAKPVLKATVMDDLTRETHIQRKYFSSDLEDFIMCARRWAKFIILLVFIGFLCILFYMANRKQLPVSKLNREM